jgi:protocatechuate 3,4-dioxygenase, beta subunit
LTNCISSFYQENLWGSVNYLQATFLYPNFDIKGKFMKRLFIIPVLSAFISLNGCGQSSIQKQQKAKASEIKAGGSCEGCEAIYESPVPFEHLNETDTLPDFNDAGPKIEISGIIYKADGKTPAQDVVLYIYHTDQNGIYAKKGNETGWANRHGYIRGWIKTNAKGEYRFYTLVPASYPNSKNPKHIHPVVKEPGISEYWIDEFLFDDDSLLPAEERIKSKPVGGNGVLKTTTKDGMLLAKRNITLGLNVADYPVTKVKSPESGLAIGSNCPAFDPVHLSGADKGSMACPMCKYGSGEGVMVWFNHADLDEMKGFVTTFEKEMNDRGVKKFRVFLVYMNPFYKENDKEGLRILQKKIIEWCEKQNLVQVAMVWTPSPVDKETAGLYKMNPKVKNTVLVYKKRRVVAKWVDMEYNNEAVKNILEKIDAPALKN